MQWKTFGPSIGFLREVQNNSSLYRHLMPDIFRFISVLATKVDTLTFGEQRRVRRDLNDIFVRLFNPVLSTKSIITATTSDNATFDEKAELGTDTLLEKVKTPVHKPHRQNPESSFKRS